MSDKLTVKEALEQGYVYYGQDKGEFQHLHSIEFISDADFENGPVMLAEKEPYYTPSISAEDIADLLADHLDSMNGDETGDDTSEVYNIVKDVDFTPTSELINEALKDKKYYKLTNIQLIPNPVVILLLFLFLASCAAPKYYSCPKDVTKISGDTIREQMLVTMRPMGFAVSCYGMSIVRDDTCRAHLCCDGRHIKAPVTVWLCETEIKRRAK